MNIQTPPSTADIEAALGLDSRGRRSVWIRRFVWLVLVLAVLAGGAWWFLATQQQAATLSYQTGTAGLQTLVVKVQATGKVVPTTEVEVSSERSGVVRTVTVKNNSIVRKGDVLAELDAERLVAELGRDKALLAAAEARLADAEATLKERELGFARAERLSRQGISATQDLDAARAGQARARAAVVAAQADIAVAKAEVVMAETDIAKMRILSPVDGIVLKRSVEPGQTVASSLQAPVLFTLAEDLKRMQLEADVDEADIGAVKTGQQASFTVDAYPGRSFPAVIETIEYSPKTTDNVVTYTAVLTVDNSDLLLRPGMTATAQIVTQTVENALAVPNAAFRYQPAREAQNQGFSITNLFIPRMPRFEKTPPAAAGDERSLWILENGTPREIKVKTGISDGRMTEIVSGELKAGDEVILSVKKAQK